MGDMNDIVKALAEESQRRQKEEVVESGIRLTTTAYAQANNYSNVIIIAGYASYFALLSAVKDVIDEKMMVWSALCVSVSVTMFVAFETYKMLYVSIMLLKRSSAFKSENPIEKEQAYMTIVRKAQTVFISIWVFVLLVCIPSALGGVGLLFYAYINALITK